ncbi:hypothetical protein [Nisaea sp.]|uniref:hypothetical protein n=1 Tax=Nisaea sp. TaxID=2024842 RepID=UPI002B26D1FA|nr:hypothetical protein [Nisaea sp.]
MPATGLVGAYWADFTRMFGWLMDGDHAFLFIAGSILMVGGSVYWSLRESVTNTANDLCFPINASARRWTEIWQQTVRYGLDRLGNWFGPPFGFRAFDRCLIIVLGYALFGPLLAQSFEHIGAITKEWKVADETATLAALAVFFSVASLGGITMWMVARGPFPIMDSILLESDLSSKIKSGQRILFKSAGVIIGAALIAFVAGAAVGAGVKSGAISHFFGSATSAGIAAIALVGALAAGVRGIAVVVGIAVIAGICSVNTTESGGIQELVISALRTGILGGAIIAGILGAAGIKITVVIAAITIVASVVTGAFMAGFGGMLIVGTYVPIFAMIAFIPQTAILTVTISATVFALLTVILGLNAFTDWLTWWAGRRLAHPPLPNADTIGPGLWPIARQLLIVSATALAASIALSAALAFSLGLAVRFGVKLDWALHLENAYTDPLGSGIGLTMMLVSPWLPVAFHLTTGLFSLIFPILRSLAEMTKSRPTASLAEQDPSRPMETCPPGIIPVSALLSASLTVLLLIILSAAISSALPDALPWLAHTACDIGNWAEGIENCML